MEEEKFMHRHPWSHLTTVTRFDEGNELMFNTFLMFIIINYNVY